MALLTSVVEQERPVAARSKKSDLHQIGRGRVHPIMTPAHSVSPGLHRFLDDGVRLAGTIQASWGII